MYERYLRQLLEPLGVYDLSAGTINSAELYALGAGLDNVSCQLDTAERESLTATAEDEGLRRREDLFARRPAAVTAEERRKAIAALLQIDGDSLTPADINKTMRGCGIKARAEELGDGKLRVVFPEAATRKRTRRSGSAFWRATGGCLTAPMPHGMSRLP